MKKTPWDIKGICLGAPLPDEMALFSEFVEKKLVPGGCNLIILLTRYRYQFKSHPECAEADALSEAQVKEIVALCRKHNIHLVPKMNLLGHQGKRIQDSVVLRNHPELDETPEIDEAFYHHSICPSNPDSKPLIFDLMDEMVDVFEADAIHIGCDEVFDIGKCPRCKDTPTYKLFAQWINALDDHNKARGIQTYMWGDRFLDGLVTGYGGWEASGNFTDPAIDLVNKNIIICDWHYEDMSKRGDGSFPSVDIFAKAGFKMLVCPWRYKENAEQFIDYALAHDHGNILGVLATTWYGSGDVARYMLQGKVEDDRADTIKALANTLDWIFSDNA